MRKCLVEESAKLRVSRATGLLSLEVVEKVQRVGRKAGLGKYDDGIG